MFFQSLPSFSSISPSPQVAQPPTPVLSTSVPTDSHVSSTNSLSPDHEIQSPHSQPSATKTYLPRTKIALAPSIHPMLTRSKSKQFVASSPHA